ncbi:MAG: endopeptidase La [Clostridiales bacterium]|jgi:ATP-dependent Lon protease|nr:endopeptidase La [Clostridiales bacterium]
MRFLPVIPLRGTVLFPNNTGHFDIGRPKSIAAVKYAFERGGMLIFAVQNDDANVEPALSDLKEIGTLAQILSVNALPNGTLRILVEGKKRAKIAGAGLSAEKINAKEQGKIENGSDENGNAESAISVSVAEKGGAVSVNERGDTEEKMSADAGGNVKERASGYGNAESAISVSVTEKGGAVSVDERGDTEEKVNADGYEKADGERKANERENTEDEIKASGRESAISVNESGKWSEITNEKESADAGANAKERAGGYVNAESSISVNESGKGNEISVNALPFLIAAFEELVPKNGDSVEADAYRRGVYDILDEYAALDRTLQGEALAAVKAEKNNDALIDKTAPLLSVNDSYPVLAETDTVKRFDILFGLLNYELEVLKTAKKIQFKVKHSIDKEQKERIMREQLRAISEELEGDSEGETIKRITALDAPDAVKNKLLKENARLKKISPMSPEFSVITEYTEFALDLPWNKRSDEIRSLAYAEAVLNKRHYGLKKVKERILEYIAVHNLTDAFKSPILCFIGPPGVGKTSVAEAIAEATGRKFVRMSLGGISDEAEIRGHRKTYVAAMAGRILNGIKLAGVNNPVFLLDEIDKLSQSNKGDPASALLEVLDPEQNVSFRDNYLELPYDLSKVMFLTTANNAETIPAPLLDRMEIIQMPSYTYEEKFRIAKNHLVKKELKNHGLTNENIKIEDGAIYEIIAKYTAEAGVRELQRQIAKLMRKAAFAAASGGKISAVTKENLAEFLGNKTVIRKKIRETDEIGIVTGLAWTQNGGDILPIEINTVKGKGNIITTGNLKDIIKESVKVALTYIRSAAEKYGIKESAFKDLDYHIHLPETSVPKEGPSAGAGFAAAVYSALTKKAVKNNAALTGEISLRGNITAVGGIKEKIMSGARAGIETFFIPKDNMPDTEEIPAEIAEKIRIIPVSHFDDLTECGLLFSEKTADDGKTKKKTEKEYAENRGTKNENRPIGKRTGIKPAEDGKDDAEDGIIGGIVTDRIYGNL